MLIRATYLICLAGGLLAVLGWNLPASAAVCPGGPDSCRTVIASIDGLTDGIRNRDLSGASYQYISVTCYHSYPLSSVICAGGGDFDRIAANSIGCASAISDNGITLIKDNHQN